MALFLSVKDCNVLKTKAINWKICFMCQLVKQEKLTDPLKSTRDTQQGYFSIANKLLEFEEIGSVPFDINLSILKGEKGLAHTLIVNEAKWHRSCYASCSSSRLGRARAKSRKRDGFADKENETPSPVKSRRAGAEEAHQRALEKIIQYITEVRLNLADTAPVFHMSDLANRYTECLGKMGIAFEVHTTRLKDKILEACPGLEAMGSPGREIAFTFKSDVSSVVRRMSSNEFQDNTTTTLAAAAAVVRKDLFEVEPCSWMDKDAIDQNACTSNSLRKLLKMIIDGTGKSSLLQDTSDPIVNHLAQIIQYHAVKRRKSQTGAWRHNRSNEFPVPVYLGLKLYKETRQKALIDTTHQLGLSISYDRVQGILTDMANHNAAYYSQEGVGCPPSLQKGVFTTAAVDNIDHDTSSTTANDSFHGTAISLVQHPRNMESGSTRQPTPTGSTGRTMHALPKEYTSVTPCFLNPKLAKFASSSVKALREKPWSESPYQQELEWLENVLEGGDAAVNWSSHHGSKEGGQVRVPTPSAILPLFKEHAATPSMMLHAMTVAMAAMKHLNPSQTPVLVADQPLYAICQSLQKLMPDVVGEDKLFVMLGPLHIEMRLLNMLGEWAEGSGWTNLLVQAGLLTQGRADSLIKGSHVTRTRYAHEVTAAVLYSLMREAYDLDGDFQHFDVWRTERRKSVPQFAYCDIFLQNELTMLQFVRSLRTANFDLYVETLSLVVPWLFALDHHHYARWCSVQVRALENVDKTHPELVAEFRAGHFVGRNSSRQFSGMGLDQLHEQLNARLKGGSGVIGLTESPDSLIKWILSGADVAAVVDQFEEATGMLKSTDYHLHHNDSRARNESFRRDVLNLKRRFEEVGNPFMETGDELYNLDNGKVIVDQVTVQSMMNMYDMGRTQYQTFAEECLDSSIKSLFDPIKKNNFKIMKTASWKKTAPARRLTSLKSDVSLFSRLWIATHVRKGDMDDFFRHENQSLPPSLTDVHGSMRQTTKSDIVACISPPPPVGETNTRPSVDLKVLDGAAVVNMLRPGATCKTFKDYIDTVQIYVEKELATVQRVDLVFDVYLHDSLKCGTRKKRGEGIRMRVTPNSKLPQSWQSFLRDSKNKEELFHLIADQLVGCEWKGKSFVVTRQSDCLFSLQDFDGSDLFPCNHEEADTRVMLHAASAARQGLSRVMIRTVDSDIVVIAVWTVNEVPDIQELWVSLGVGKSHSFIPAHEIARTLGPQACKVLPTFHAFSGCDNTSSFATIGKKTAFDAWQAYEEGTCGLMALSEGHLEDSLPTMEKFVITMYCRTATASTVNECGKDLFTRGRQLQSLPPTQDALRQHLKRVAYQAKVWGQSLIAMQDLPSPALWGWTRRDGDWEPQWITLKEASKACLQLVACKCKECKMSSCSCLKNTKWRCSALCSCSCNIIEAPVTSDSEADS